MVYRKVFDICTEVRAFDSFCRFLLEFARAKDIVQKKIMILIAFWWTGKEDSEFDDERVFHRFQQLPRQYSTLAMGGKKQLPVQFAGPIDVNTGGILQHPIVHYSNDNQVPQKNFLCSDRLMTLIFRHWPMPLISKHRQGNRNRK